MINVTRTDLPDLEEYVAHLKDIWAANHITNNGPKLQQLERELQFRFQNQNVLCVSNGTIALQLAIRALNISQEIITTPFSYVATTNSILWEQCTPVFADIRASDFCIDPTEIEKKITPRTQAILAVHVYGYPCDIPAIEKIAREHHLKVIYDAAHAFDVKLNGIPLCNFGDVSTLSFHATKLFHAVEGGAVISRYQDVREKVHLLRAFGHRQDEYVSIGINGKQSEFHAAMGLVMLPKVKDFIEKRQKISKQYDELLKDLPLQRPVVPQGLDYNYAYYPVVFADEMAMLKCFSKLNEERIIPRRYFYPSLNRLPHLKADACPISEGIASRVLCLPLYSQLDSENVARIGRIVRESLS